MAKNDHESFEDYVHTCRRQLRDIAAEKGGKAEEVQMQAEAIVMQLKTFARLLKELLEQDSHTSVIAALYIVATVATELLSFIASVLPTAVTPSLNSEDTPS